MILGSKIGLDSFTSCGSCPVDILSSLVASNETNGFDMMSTYLINQWLASMYDL
jgi:hypothetical protein